MKKKITQRPKPSVSIVGAGRLGQALAIALHSSGYPIQALVARHAPHARKAAALINKLEGPILALGADHLHQLPASDVILITTPDDAIKSTAEALASSQKHARRGQTVLHTSGALASDVLSPLAKLGFHTGSLHPLVSVNEPYAGAKALCGAFYCLEGDQAALLLAQLIVTDLKGTSFSIQPNKKALYHAAAVMASGHLVALFDLTSELLAACGMSQKSAQRILIPLVESTVNNVKDSGPEQALTGTFARGDLATVQRHLEMLSRKQFAEELEVYKLLGLRSIQLADKAGLEPQVLQQIKTALETAKSAPR
ncbi:MAG: DUF2520 domain-containing protein [Acidobacteriota bacterium]|nr:DUF2520 domain-containing protein [Acidobacteriota bacterium]